MFTVAVEERRNGYGAEEFCEGGKRGDERQKREERRKTKNILKKVVWWRRNDEVRGMMEGRRMHEESVVWRARR